MSVIPKGHAERSNWFRQLAHVVHLGRCTRFPYGDCHRHEDAEYFTPKDNDIASVLVKWIELGQDAWTTPRVDELTRLLQAHRPYGLDCKCGLAINSDAHWASHVAALVAAS